MQPSVPWRSISVFIIERMAIIHSLKCTVPFSFAVPLVVMRCHSFSLVVICCHSLSPGVTRCTSCCYSSLSVICCTTRCHLLSPVVPIIVIHCHSLSLDVTLVCLFINDLIKKLKLYYKNIYLRVISAFSSIFQILILPRWVECSFIIL